MAAKVINLSVTDADSPDVVQHFTLTTVLDDAGEFNPEYRNVNRGETVAGQSSSLVLRSL